MRYRHIFLAAAFIVTINLSAQQERLGPEVRIAPSGPAGPAAFEQDQPAVASNGEGFLAVWNDRREDTEEGVLYGARLNADGTPAHPFGRRIAKGIRGAQLARIASNGSDYLVTWVGRATYTLRVDKDGTPIGALNTFPTFLLPQALASNGSTYLLLAHTPASSSASRLIRTLLDADGRTLWQFDEGARNPVWLGASGSTYEYIDYSLNCVSPGSCLVSLSLHQVQESGAITTSPLSLPMSVPYPTRITVAAAPDRFLIALHDAFSAQTVRFLTVGRDGTLLSGPFEFAVPDLVTSSDAIWDDGEFYFVMHQGRSARGLRLPRDGDPRGRTAVEISPSATAIPVLASNGTAGVLVWPDLRFSTVRDIVSRPIDGGEPMLVSRSEPAELAAQVAYAQSHQLAVWLDEFSSTIRGVFDGLPLTIRSAGSPRSITSVRLAAGAQNFLVTWWERRPNGNSRVFARRIGLDGRLLDAAPIEVFSAAANLFEYDLDVAYGNSEYLVAATGSSLYTTRVRDDGTTFDERALNAFGMVTDVKAVWNGTNFFVAVASGLSSPFEPLVGPYYTVALVRFGNTTDWVRLAEQVDTLDLRLAAAAGRDRVTVVWKRRSRPDSEVTQVDFDLRVLSNARPGPITGNEIGELAMIWTGTEYLLAWPDAESAGNRLLGQRLAENGAAIDSAFELSRPGALRFAPSLTRNGTGVAIGYSRSDEASGGAPRALVRLFGDAPPKRRGIRH